MCCSCHSRPRKCRGGPTELLAALVRLQNVHAAGRQPVVQLVTHTRHAQVGRLSTERLVISGRGWDRENVQGAAAGLMDCISCPSVGYNSGLNSRAWPGEGRDPCLKQRQKPGLKQRSSRSEIPGKEVTCVLEVHRRMQCIVSD